MEQKKWMKTTVGVVITAVICNILWGSAFPFIKTGYRLFGIGGDVASVMLFAGIRFMLAGLLVIVISWGKNGKFPKVNCWKNIIAVAMVQTALQYIFYYIGVANTTGTNGSIVNSTSSFFGVILAHFAYRDDRLTWKKILGVLLGFAGVLAVTMENGTMQVSLLGEGFILIAAFVFAFSSLLNKRAGQTDDPFTVTGYNLLLGGIVLTAIGLLGGGKIQQVTPLGIVVLLYLAVLSSVAFSLWATLLKSNPVSKISVYNFVIPVTGTLLSALMLHENIANPKYILSLALVCVGIVLVNRSANKPKASIS